MTDPLVETWQINHRINLYVLDHIAPEAWAADKMLKLRSVGEQFAHIHNVRLMWLKGAAPDLMEGLAKLEKEAATDPVQLRSSLEQSGQAVATLVTRSVAAGGKVKGFKPHVTAFVGYLIAHESYHRAEVGVLLTQMGHPLSQSVSYGMWEWGVR
jgi:uncharacterized damage-inducible protein DinB